MLAIRRMCRLTHFAPALALTAALASATAGCETIGRLEPGQGGLVPTDACGRPTAPAGCGTACTADLLCGAGLHCDDDGLCVADCLPDDPEAACSAAETCTARGRCVPDAVLLDGGAGVDAGDDCAVTLEADPTIPTVLFLVDRSSSMEWEFRSTNTARWDALSDALFGRDGGPDGLLPTLEDRVRFGMTLYTGWHDDRPGAACPLLESVAPGFERAGALAALYRDHAPEPDSSTPTAEAVDALVAATAPSPDGPTLIVLATDGAPNTCEEPTERDEAAQAGSVAAVERAREAGYETRVLSLADIGQKHSQDLANAGAGLPVLDAYGPGDARATFYAPGDAEGLATDLGEIVQGTLSCEIEIDGRIDVTRACEGLVLLDGVEVPCDAPGSGWEVVDESTFVLRGEACEDLEAGRVTRVEARFPCGVVLR